jgi:hypothetical protein
MAVKRHILVFWFNDTIVWWVSINVAKKSVASIFSMCSLKHWFYGFICLTNYTVSHRRRLQSEGRNVYGPLE